MAERRRACAARCVFDVICGCHGDAIDWPTRRQTSRESRRHSGYCPPPAPPRRLAEQTVHRHLVHPDSPCSVRRVSLAHLLVHLHARCSLFPCVRARANASVHTKTHYTTFVLGRRMGACVRACSRALNTASPRVRSTSAQSLQWLEG